MAFFGKTFTFDREENFEEFLKSTNIPEAIVSQAKDYKPKLTFLKNDDGTYTYKSEHPLISKTLTFSLNTPIDDTAFDGRKVTSTFTMDGSTLYQEQKAEDGKVFKSKREFTDSTLKQTFSTSVSDVVGVRYYKA